MSAKLKPIITKTKPILTFVLTQILLALLISATAYFIFEHKDIKPRYAISSPEMVAEATADAPRLKLFWDNEEVKNVYSLKIAIWNAGREYLDKSSISATAPIRVTYPPDVQILYADFIRTSRDNLSFTATDLSSTSTRAIQIQIVGDEALEQKDGGVLKILYTGQGSDEFAVTGRIKGSKQGFKEVSWAALTKEGSLTFTAAAALMVLFCAFFMSRAFKRFRDNRLEALLDIVMAGSFTIMGIILLIETVQSWLLNLQWIT